MEVRKKEKIRNEYNQVPYLSRRLYKWDSDKITRKHLAQESQEVIPADDHKAAGNRQDTNSIQ